MVKTGFAIFGCERVTFEEIDKAIRAMAAQPDLAPLVGETKAALVWMLDPLRIVWASPQTYDLTRALVLDKSGRIAPYFPGAARIEALLRGIAPRGGQRLEKVRFETSALAPLATCACRLVTMPNGQDALITGFVERVPNVRKPRLPRTEAAAEKSAAPDDTPKHDRVAQAAGAAAAPAAPPSAADSPPPAPEPAPPPAMPEPVRAPDTSPVRFLWEADGAGLVTHVSEELARTVGKDNAAIIGKRFADLLGDSEDARAVDPKDMLCEIMARGETFSGRRIYWRSGQGGDAIAVDLAGLPTRTPDGTAYRGFGICRPGITRPWGELRAQPIPASVSKEPPMPAPDIAAPRPDPAQAPLARIATVSPYSLDRPPLTPGMGEAREGDAREGEAWQAVHFDESRAVATAQTRIDAKLGDPEPPPFKPIEIDPLPREPAPDTAAEPVVAGAGGDDIAPEQPVQRGATSTKAVAASLSDEERNAFREIARALGAPTGAAPQEKATVGEATHETTAHEVAASTTIDDSATPDAAEGAEDMEPAEEPQAGPEPTGDEDAAGEQDEQARERNLEPSPRQDDSRVILAPANDRAPDIRAVLDRIPAGIVVHRGEQALFANRFLLDLLGHANLQAFDQAGGLARLFVARPHALGEAAREAVAPLTIQDARGASVAVEIRMTTIDWSGYPASMLMLRRIADEDPTEKLRELELDLRAREDRLREQAAILDTAIDGVIVIDQSGRILSLNRAAEALFGYDQREVAGESFTQLLHTESHVAALDYLDAMRGDDMRAVLNDGREVLGRVRQGGAIPLFMTLGAVGDGLDRKFCAVLRDMTAFKQTETELVAARRTAEAANAQKSDFLARISHEVRTPLNAIIGFAEVMLEERFGPVGNERYRDYLADIHASGEHVISLVNDLLDLAKIEAGRLELNFTAVSLNEMVNACVALLQPQAARERIVLRTSFAENLPNLSVDERSLRQIILNLLSNAVKFTDAGGQVIVSTAKGPDGDMVFRVRDTGIGMNDTEVEAALEPFRQLATARKPGGTGLGLPLTKALVEANQGTLRISSRKDEGTLAEVVFPPARILAR